MLPTVLSDLLNEFSIQPLFLKSSQNQLITVENYSFLICGTQYIFWSLTTRCRQPQYRKTTHRLQPKREKKTGWPVRSALFNIISGESDWRRVQSYNKKIFFNICNLFFYIQYLYCPHMAVLKAWFPFQFQELAKKKCRISKS